MTERPEIQEGERLDDLGILALEARLGEQGDEQGLRGALTGGDGREDGDTSLVGGGGAVGHRQEAHEQGTLAVRVALDDLGEQLCGRPRGGVLDGLDEELLSTLGIGAGEGEGER